MAIVLYVLGGLMAAAGVLWALVTAFGAILSGHYANLVTVIVAAAYVVLAGALFLGIGAIIRRLDRIVANTGAWAVADAFEDEEDDENEREEALRRDLGDEPPLTRQDRRHRG